MNECEVFFRLFGSDFDPSIALELVEMDSAVTKEKGDPIPKFSSWYCTTGKIKNEVIDVYALASTLLSPLYTQADKILELKQRFELKAVLEVALWITMDDSKSTPAIGFESDVIHFLDRVGATIDIDTYRAAPFQSYSIDDYPDVDTVAFPESVSIAYAVCGKSCGNREYIVDGQSQICQHCGKLMFRTLVQPYKPLLSE